MQKINAARLRRGRTAMFVIRTLFLHLADVSQPAIPAEWRGMQAVVNQQTPGGHVVDEFHSNEIHVLDIGQLGHPNPPSSDVVADAAYMFTRWLRIHWQDRAPAILVAGQTPLAERCVRQVRAHANPPYIIVRFSMYYAQGGAPYPDSATPAELYSHDCPKDFSTLWQFLGNPDIIDAVARMDNQALTVAVRSFAFSRAAPILTFVDPGEPPVLVGF